MKVTAKYSNHAKSWTGTVSLSVAGSVRGVRVVRGSPMVTANQLTQQLFNAGSTVNYTYDPIGQLKVADSATASEDRGYRYDAAWNLSYRTNNGVPTSFTLNTKNEVTKVGSKKYHYDGNGNRIDIHEDLPWYGYDDENRLIVVEDEGSGWRTEFTYDGTGRLRVRLDYAWSASYWVLASRTYYLYDGMRVIQERNSSNVPLVSYTRGTDLSVTLEGAGGIGGLLGRSHGYSAGNWSTHNFYHADGNGNITYLVNSSQGLAASYRYDPYGNTISSSGTLASANVYRFSSKEIHANSGLYYYGFRFYDPNTQRWLNHDPVQERGGLNLYGFVLNNPVNFDDPLGLDRNHNAPPSSDYIFPKPPPPDDGPWDDGYTDCWIKCMLGLPTAADVALHMGGAEKVAGAYYHFTDGRFTAWGRSSKVLVPKAAGKLGLIGLGVTVCEAFHCADKCWKETSGTDPDPPPPPYVPPYPPSWPGRGHNAPPVLQ